MPVPLATTHPKGKGLTAANAIELPSEGPFERMARLRAEAEANQQQKDQNDTQQPAQVNLTASAGPAVSNPSPSCSVAVNHLDFSYPGLDGRPVPGQPPLISDMNLSLEPGSRCLLLGANGAGKTTLLKILGGKHMVPRDSVQILGCPPFHDTTLTTTGDLSYIGGTWQRDVAFAGYSVPLTGDFPAQKMIDAVPGVDAARKEKLIKVLDIDPSWRMHQVSDGQRRRVQICVGLLRPFKVLLLDEITVDLDVLGRSDLMRFLQEECEQRGATIIYATHIFDGLEFWPTHVAYVARGRLQMCKKASEVPELREGRLLEMVEGLLREHQAAMKAERPRVLEWDESREGLLQDGFSYAFNNGWVPGTLGTSLANSSNAVMRT